jgi:hypothetical protein
MHCKLHLYGLIVVMMLFVNVVDPGVGAGVGLEAGHVLSIDPGADHMIDRRRGHLMTRRENHQLMDHHVMKEVALSRLERKMVMRRSAASRQTRSIIVPMTMIIRSKTKSSPVQGVHLSHILIHLVERQIIKRK